MDVDLIAFVGLLSCHVYDFIIMMRTLQQQQHVTQNERGKPFY